MAFVLLVRFYQLELTRPILLTTPQSLMQKHHILINNLSLLNRQYYKYQKCINQKFILSGSVNNHDQISCKNKTLLSVCHLIFHELTTIYDLNDFISKHCVKYAKFTTAKKHVQVLPYKGILSTVTITLNIAMLLVLFLKIIICTNGCRCRCL